MKNCGAVLLIFALHHAVASEQKSLVSAFSSMEDFLGPSPDQVKAFSAALGGHDSAAMSDFFDDSDDDDVSSKPALKTRLSAKTPQHGPVASLLHISDKQKVNSQVTKTVGQTVKVSVQKVKVSAATEDAKVSAQKVDTSAATEDATSMQLKQQLAQSQQAQVALRARFKQVGSSLLNQFKALKIQKKQSEAKLRNEIEQERAKRKEAEADESKLKAELAAAKASEPATGHTTQQTSMLQDTSSKLRKEIQEQGAKLKKAEASNSKLMAQLSSTKASALSGNGAAAAICKTNSKLLKKIQEESAQRKKAEASNSKLMAQLSASEASGSSASRAAAVMREADSKLRKQLQEESAMRQKAEASDSKSMALLSATEASVVSAGRTRAKMSEADQREMGKLSKEIKAMKMQEVQETKKLQDKNSKLQKEIQEENAKRKLAEAVDRKLSAQLSEAQAAALSTADHLAVGKLSEELKAVKMQSAQRTKELDEVQMELEKAQKQLDAKAKARKGAVMLQNEMASMLTAQMNEQKAAAEKRDQEAKAENSKLVGELSLQKTQAAAAEVSAEAAEAELTDQLAAANKDSAASVRRAAAAATEKAEDKRDAQMRKLKEDFQTKTAQLKAKVMLLVKGAEAASAKKIKAAKDENRNLRGQLREFQQAEGKTQSEVDKVQKEAKAKAPPAHNLLHQMTAYLSVPGAA